MLNFKMAAEKEDFIRLRSTDESFQRRSDFVFARLERQEPTAAASEGVRRERREQRSPRRRRNGNGQRLPARVPQHVLSPEKWTKYSLEIDGSESFRGINEHSLNSHVAHSFLDTLRKRKAEKIEEPSERLRGDSAETKISFRKPFVSKESDELSHGSEKGVWKNGTFVMPEYMAGVSGRRSQAKRSGVRSPAGCAKVSLGHLAEGSGNESTSGSAGFVKKQKRKRVFKKRKVDEDEEVEKEMNKEDEKIMDDEEDGRKMDDDGGEDGEKTNMDGNKKDSDNNDC